MIWAKIAEYALGIINTLTGWAKQTSDQNVGRTLQNADDLTASVKLDHEAAQTRQDVAGLSDADLDGELRNGPSAGRR